VNARLKSILFLIWAFAMFAAAFVFFCLFVNGRQ